MKEIPIIRKDSLKEYKIKKNLIYRGAILAFVLFLLGLINNSVKGAILLGLFGWVSLIFIFLIIWFKTEYYDRRKTIKRLKSDRYKFLHLNNFEITEDLFLEGVYDDYYIRVYPLEKQFRKRRNMRYDIVEVFYTIDGEPDDISKKERQISDEYHFGYLIFQSYRVGLVPKNIIEEPNFKENIENIIRILKIEELNPISIEDWKTKYTEKQKEEQL